MSSTGPGHGHKRRLYPQQQYNYPAPAAPSPYDMYAGAQAPVQPGSVDGAPMNANYGQPHPQAGMFTPAAASAAPGPVGAGPVDALAQQFGNVGLNPAYTGGPGVSGVATTPSYGGPTDPYQQPHDSSMFAPKLPLNQLYNMDLVQSLPPHIEDLSYPPPPIVVPPELSATRHPEANAPSNYIRCTLNVVPNSSSLLKKSKLPLALVIRPCVSLTDAGAPIPTVGDAMICRCRRCRSYINPFVEFVDHGNRWRCNMCGLTNEVPAQFDWDGVRSERVNRVDRCELNYGVTEFIAPPEYMVRPPQPPVYVFILDCSVTAVQNGLLATAARIIQENLDRLPNYDGRTRVAFIAVDSALHFFHLPLPSAVQTEPSMLVVSDLEDPFLPVPSGLLVNLAECRAPIDILLNSIGTMFTKTTDNGCALGSAIKAAPKLIGSLGGKIICLSASLPNLGHAKLDAREDRKVLGTSKESSLLQTANSFYKSFAVECNRAQVTVDMFLFGSSYQDVASLSNLPRYTAGQTYFYPGWSASRAEDTIKLAHELGEHMSMEMVMEAVLRVRASNGLRMNAFYGNFFNRSSDLCSFPTFPRDQSYVVEVAFEEMITKPYVAFQAGILHTTCHGDRRIRVITLTLPVSSVLQDIYASADQLAITAYYTHKAVEKALSSGLQEARDLLTNRLAELLQTYKKELMSTNVGASAPLQFCTNLRMLPLLVNALVKHVGLRKSAQIPSDLRSAALCLLSTLPLPYLIKYIHPDFYRLDDMPLHAGLPDPETGQLIMPPKLNLSGEQIVSSGLYLIDDGQTMFLWIGHDAVPQLVEDVFGVDSLSIVRSGKGEIPELDPPPDVPTDPQENPRALFNARVRSIISRCREKNDSITWQSLYIIKGDGDPSLRLWASTFFIEDRTDQSVSYYQFLVGLRDKLNS